MSDEPIKPQPAAPRKGKDAPVNPHYDKLPAPPLPVHVPRDGATDDDATLDRD